MPAWTGIFRSDRHREWEDNGNSAVGAKSDGADLGTLMMQVEKTTGKIQFDVQIAEYDAVTLGVNRPKEANGNHFTNGPLRNANVTLAPNAKALLCHEQ